MIKKILLTILVAFFVASPAFAFNPLVACPGSVAVAGGSEEIGYTTAGTEDPVDFVSGNIRCSAIDAPSGNGTITSISMYSSCASELADLKVGIYQDDTGAPTTRIGTEATFTDEPSWALGWKSFTVSFPVSSGVSYWICVESVYEEGVHVYLYYDVGAAGSRHYDANDFSAWPATFTSDSNSTALYSFKATVEF